MELQPHQLLRSIDCEGALAVAVLRSDGDARLERRLEGGSGEARRLPPLRFFFGWASGLPFLSRAAFFFFFSFFLI